MLHRYTNIVCTMFFKNRTKFIPSFITKAEIILQKKLTVGFLQKDITDRSSKGESFICYAEQITFIVSKLHF